jgi:predicted permease
VSRTDPQRALQSSARASNGAGGRRGLNALVICEIALSLVLLISAGLFITAFQRLQSVDPGFQPENVLSYRISLPEMTYGEAAQQKAFFDEHVADLEALPGVIEVGTTTHEPFGGHTGNFFVAEGAPPRGEDEPNPVILTRIASFGYFKAIGINLLAGRTFTPADVGEDVPPVVVVNQSFAELHWPGEDPIGKRIAFPGDDPNWITVIGMTQDVKHYGLSEEMRPGVYLSADRVPQSSLTVVVRTGVDPLSIAERARELVLERDPEVPIYRAATMIQRLDDSLWSRRAASWTFVIFSGVALLLAVSGIYGVVSYAVNRRTHEIGIRMALGAQRRQVLAEVIRHGSWLLAAGVVLGLGGAAAAAQGLASLLFEVSATDPVVYTVVTVLLAAVALLANLIPARRAASIDPMDALRID